MIQRVLANPIAGYVFTRLTGIERRLEAASEAFSPFKKQDGEYVRDDNGNRIPEDPKRAALLETGCGQHSILMMRWSLDPRSPMPTWNSSRRSNRW
jgi:hypothetical protein